MKLSVGTRDPRHLREMQALRAQMDPPVRHMTRQMPRRAAEIAAGGSLYWVIAGSVLLRQRVLSLAPAVRGDGSPCTSILLDPELVPVCSRPVRAFQGWRYLEPATAPPDVDPAGAAAGLPEALAQQLRALCLL